MIYSNDSDVDLSWTKYSLSYAKQIESWIKKCCQFYYLKYIEAEVSWFNPFSINCITSLPIIAERLLETLNPGWWRLWQPCLHFRLLSKRQSYLHRFIIALSMKLTFWGGNSNIRFSKIISNIIEGYNIDFLYKSRVKWLE